MVSKSVRFSLVFMVLCGLVYPLATAGLARLIFPRQAEGSLVRAGDGTVIGSDLIGQSFASPEYFHGRISAVNYNASASGASNLAPSDPALLDRVKADVARWRADNPGQPVPADLLTASGSGLDPHISPEAADSQIPRVAQATGIDAARLRALVASHIEGRTLGVFGEPRVNVLELNLALRQLLGR